MGPGYVESLYEGALKIEFRRRGIFSERQKGYEYHYKGELAGVYQADLVVENRILIELKAVSQLNRVMEAQILNYLRVSGLKVGLVTNLRFATRLCSLGIWLILRIVLWIIVGLFFEGLSKKSVLFS